MADSLRVAGFYGCKPPLSPQGKHNEIKMFRSAMKNALTLANDNLKVQSVSFPALSTEIFDFPAEKCVEEMVSSIMEYV